jgi:hydroxymethylglutaryl-CoA synthase
MIVRAAPRLLALEVGRTGSYARDVYDFWRPLHRKDALVDGHYSVQCYLDALAGAYREWRSLAPAGDVADAPLARTCYHVPYGKMARKAHRARRMIDGLDEQAADATFATEVSTSLTLPSLVGNVYTGSLYLALASLLHHEAETLEGSRLGLFSYGSGCSAEFFAGRVVDGAAALMRDLDVDAPIRASERLSIEAYEALRRADAAAERPSDERTNERREASAASAGSRVAFLGVDGGERRVYGTA